MKLYVIVQEFVDSSFLFGLSLKVDTFIPNVLLSIFGKHNPHQSLDCFYSQNVEKIDRLKSQTQNKTFRKCQNKFWNNMKF